MRKPGQRQKKPRLSLRNKRGGIRHAEEATVSFFLTADRPVPGGSAWPLRVPERFVVNQHLDDVVFRDLCYIRLNLVVAGNVQAAQVQIEIASQLGRFNGSEFNSSASGKVVHIQCADEGDGFPIGPEAGEIRATQEPCSSAVNVPKFSVKSRPSPRALLDSNIQLGIAFQR